MREQMTAVLRFAVVSIVGILLGVGNACADLKFGIAAEPYPPFESKDATGKWIGWEIDLMDAVCKQLKEKCEIVEGLGRHYSCPHIQTDRRHLVVDVDHSRTPEGN